MNIVAAPIIWFIFPEVAGKTLEEVNLLFTADSLLASQNMKEYYRRLDEAGGNPVAAERRLFDEVDGNLDDFHFRSGAIPMGKTPSSDVERHEVSPKA